MLKPESFSSNMHFFRQYNQDLLRQCTSIETSQLVASKPLRVAGSLQEKMTAKDYNHNSPLSPTPRFDQSYDHLDSSYYYLVRIILLYSVCRVSALCCDDSFCVAVTSVFCNVISESPVSRSSIPTAAAAPALPTAVKS